MLENDTNSKYIRLQHHFNAENKTEMQKRGL